MRLSELNPEWFAEEGREGQGVTFDCPCCGTARIAVAFENPLDDGPPIYLAPRVIWPVLWPPYGTPDSEIVTPDILSRRTGTTFEDLTIEPGIDASSAGHWRGSILNGEIA